MQSIMDTKDSLTGDYLSGRREITVPKKRRTADKTKELVIEGATGNNLRDGLGICVRFDP